MDNFKIVKLESEQHFVKRYDDLIKSYLSFGEWADDAKGKFYEIRNILTELQFSQYQINNFRFKYFANESKSLEMPGLWLVGYGNWTGYASATIIGVNRTAKQTILEIEEFLKNSN